ncbi:MAG: glucosaminidase domain-containing protein [Pseudomonadota bacterium]
MQTPLLTLTGALFVCLIGLMTTTRTSSPGDVPDFEAFVAGPERKAEFFAFMRPLLESQNAQVLEDRERLLELATEAEAGFFARRWLADLAARYDVATADNDGNPYENQIVVDALLRRVDVVPVPLGLAQAAKESGWGTSRFARQGNNYFGEWCFTDGCGIVPGARADGRNHEVEAFDSPAESVASYVNNINTHRSYKAFRDARKVQRDRQAPLSSVRLAEELSRYSERRDDYVAEIKQLIINNRLDTPTSGGS